VDEYRAGLTRGLLNTHERVQLCTADLTDEEANRVVAGLTPIIWQAGHVVLTEAGYAKRGGAPVELPPSFETLFKMGTGGQAKYPPLAEVRQAFETTHQALLKIAASGNLATPTEAPSYSNVGEMLVGANVHRAYHIGKMTTLRALLEKKRLFG
jgi:hypothetical protein